MATTAINSPRTAAEGRWRARRPAETVAEPVFILVGAREPEQLSRQRAATDHGCGARAPRRPQRGEKSTLTVTQAAAHLVETAEEVGSLIARAMEP